MSGAEDITEWCKAALGKALAERHLFTEDGALYRVTDVYFSGTAAATKKNAGRSIPRVTLIRGHS
jgi:hypothetical protein